MQYARSIIEISLIAWKKMRLRKTFPRSAHVSLHISRYWATIIPASDLKIHSRVQNGATKKRRKKNPTLYGRLFIIPDRFFFFLCAGLAWLIIPHKWRWGLIDGWIEITSWRLFLALCAIPGICASCALYFFPESPRFLMAKQRPEDALDVFKKIYALNTGKDPDTYPVSMQGRRKWLA